MAADKYYVWSPLPKETDERTGVVKSHYKVGEEVSQASLEVDDDTWAYMVNAGSVRTSPYPEALTKDPADPRSPSQYYREILTRAGEGRATTEELQELANLGNALTPDGYTPSSSMPLPEGVEVPDDTKTASGGTASASGTASGKS